MKLAFIVQRYGREILGGSETLARQLAERLSRRHDITVLTTTAQDYITWKNEYEPGEEKLRGVKVLRFPVEGERDLEEFNRFSEGIYKDQPTREQELEWLDRQGPVVPELIEYLRKEHHRFDLLVFFTYLYYPTYHGLSVAPEKSILVPTAHDEPPLKLGIFKEMFQLPSSFIFNTEAEEVLVLERFPVHKKMRETIGMGMELLDQPDPASFRKKHDVPGKYLLYAGRIVAGKGLEELFRYFDFYREEYPASGNFQLILIGKLEMKLPESSAIRYIGFVDEADKLSAMAGALAVVQPSRMESLSIVTLEAFSVGTPVVVTAQSRVLVDHCRRSNAGLYYGDFEEFEEILNLLFGERNLGRSLGRNGQKYVKENFGWSKLLSKYELVFRASARPSREPKAVRAKGAAAAPETEPRSRPPEEKRAAEAKERAREAFEPKGAVPREAEASDRPKAESTEAPPPEAEPEEPPGEPAVATAGERPRREERSRGAPREERTKQEPQKAREPQRAREPQKEMEPQKAQEPEQEKEPHQAKEQEEAREPRVPREPQESQEPEELKEAKDEEPVDEELTHLPSFYRSAVPAKPPAPRPAPAPAPDLPTPPSEAAGETPPDVKTADTKEKPEEEKTLEEEKEPEKEGDAAPLEEGELPAFYRASVPPKPPAPRPAPAPGLPSPPPGEGGPEAREQPPPPKAPEEEALEEGELPAFYRPRPKGEGN